MASLYIGRSSGLEELLMFMDRAALNASGLEETIMGLVQQAADAALDVLRVVEQVAPLSADHVYFAMLHHRHLCRLAHDMHSQESSKVRDDAAMKLFMLWAARRGT